MNQNSIYIFCIIALFLSGCDNQASDQMHSEFGWLLGTWERLELKKGQHASEIWTVTEDGNLLGHGIFINGVDTVFQEKMHILKRNEKWFFVADVPKNEAPVYFDLVDFSQDGFTAENPEHDFPKKIKYVLARSGKRIVATVSGGDKSLNFKFKKSK